MASRNKSEINFQAQLSSEQTKALELLESGENVFVTGGAGSGKSFLIRAFMSNHDPKTFPILASTGAAAVLLGGRTFHSFFGLGIMEGGTKATLDRVMQNTRTLNRIKKVEGIIIDEISMIPAGAFEVAETLCQIARESSLPWGGMRVIVVGDFAQLPPVSRQNKKEWSFQSEVWKKSGFQSCLLSHNQRVQDDEFLNILSDIRYGQVTARVRNFLESKMREHDHDDKSTRLFSRRDQSEQFNNRELAEIPKPEIKIDSIYLGDERHVEILKKNSPVPGQLILKEGARIIFLQNDPQKRWVNGTRGTIVDIAPDKLTVEKSSGREVTVEKGSFALQNSDGNTVATVINFPVALAYATTIHKSQGATLDELWVDLTHLWEPGHAYVALSRLRSGNGLRLLGWNSRSFIVDPHVVRFYQQLENLI